MGAEQGEKVKTPTSRGKPGKPNPVGKNGKLICGARKGKGPNKGKLCQKPAGWGTDHLGTGRCKYHGGCSTGPRNGPGIYRTKLTPDLQQVYDQFAADPNLKRLDDEVLLVKTLIVSAMDKGVGPSDLSELVDRLSRIIKRKVEIEEGLKVYVHVDQINFVVNQVVQVVERHVTDPTARANIARDLRGITLNPDR